MKKENIVPAVEKMMILLGYLGKKAGGATQPELMKAAGLTASTCYRILQTLRKHDWIRQRDGSAYDLSNGMMPIVLKLSSLTARLQEAQPILERLTARTGLSSKLSIRQGDEQVTILRAESSRPISVSGKLGCRFPIIEGSVGAALLAGEASGDIEILSSACGDPIAEKKTPGMILARIREIGRLGFCRLEALQNRWKVATMSMPVRDSGGTVVAAVTVLGMDDDFQPRHVDDLFAALRSAVSGCEELMSPSRLPKSSLSKEPRSTVRGAKKVILQPAAKPTFEGSDPKGMTRSRNDKKNL